MTCYFNVDFILFVFVFFIYFIVFSIFKLLDWSYNMSVKKLPL